MSLFERKTWRIALAEFVIIVSGVLVALAADSAMSARMDRGLERDYLQALVADLESDIGDMDERMIPSGREAQAAGQRIRDALRPSGQPQDSVALVADVVRLVNYGSFDVRAGTIEELRSTGRLGLIRSRDIRNEVQSYYALTSDMVLVDEAHRAVVLEAFNRHLAGELGSIVIAEAFQQRTINGFTPEYQQPDSLRHQAARAFPPRLRAEEGGLRRFLEVSLSLAGKRHTMYQLIRSRAVELVDLLEAELGTT